MPHLIFCGCLLALKLLPSYTIFYNLTLTVRLPMRYWMRFVDVTKMGRWKELYGREDASREAWDTHIESLKRVVPEEKLFFFNVEDG